MEQTMEPVAQTTPAQSAVETPTPAGAPGSAPTPPKSRKKRKKTTRRIIALVLVIALGFGLYRHFGKKEGAGEQQVVKDTVMYGSITSTVEGSGMVKAKNSETITLATAGTVTDVFVTEGQQVMAGDPLFTYDSPAAEKDVRDAKADIEGYQKKLNAAYKDIAALTLTAPYAGKLLETAQLAVGDEVSGQKVATLVDDTRMRLTQYFSYAYEGELYAGQTVQVSIPALMATVEGTVEKVHMVKRVTSEGSELFSAEIVVPNAGVLAKDMAASATVVVNGETVYPYEAGKLDYYRTSELSIPAGTVVATNLIDYLENHLSGRIPVTEQDYERLYGASKLPGRRTVELMPIRGRAAQPQEMVRETGREVFSTEHEMPGKMEDRGMAQQDESSRVTEEELQALLQELLTV